MKFDYNKKIDRNVSYLQAAASFMRLCAVRAVCACKDLNISTLVT